MHKWIKISNVEKEMKRVTNYNKGKGKEFSNLKILADDNWWDDFKAFQRTPADNNNYLSIYTTVYLMVNDSTILFFVTDIMNVCIIYNIQIHVTNVS